MARVIRIDTAKEKEVTHGTCGAVIGYYQNEVQKGQECDYTGDCDTVYFITCPHCGKKVYVKGY